MSAPSVARYLIERFLAEEVTHIFGVPGGFIYPLIHEAHKEPSLKLTFARHEGGAMAMADGYARGSGRLGVCAVTAGPGATNALSHMAAASAEGSPVLLISGQNPRASFGRPCFQDSTGQGVDTVALFGEVCRQSALVLDSRALPALLDGAIASAVRSPGGGVHLSIPHDVYADPVAATPRRKTSGGLVLPPRPATLAMEELLVRLGRAERPLLLLGNGARGAMRGSRAGRLAERCRELGIAVMTTPKAKGIYPERDEASLGVHGVGGGRGSVAFLREHPPDVLCVVGSRLGEWASNVWSDDLAAASWLVQVDLDATIIGRTYPVDLGVVSDAAAFLDELIGGLAGPREPEGRRLVEHRRAAIQRGRAAGAVAEDAPVRPAAERPLRPQAVVRELARWLRGDKIVFLDMGNITGWCTRDLEVAPPVEIHTAYGAAAMGWATAAVIGGKIARPDATCVAITGDGAFLMNAVEIATARHHRVGAIWVVIDDDCWNMVRQAMGCIYEKSYADGDLFSLGGVDLVGLATSLGAHACRVREPGALAAELDRAERRAREDRTPQVIVVEIDRDEEGPFLERHRSLRPAARP